jgi:hypothetical protein
MSELPGQSGHALPDQLRQFRATSGHHCRCLAELRELEQAIEVAENAVDVINYCSRQLLVPWSIVRHTTWHAPSPLVSKC